MHPGVVLNEKAAKPQCQKMVRMDDLMALAGWPLPRRPCENARTHTAGSIGRRHAVDDLRNNSFLWVWIPARARKGSLGRDDVERAVANNDLRFEFQTATLSVVFARRLSPTRSGMTGRSSIQRRSCLKRQASAYWMPRLRGA